MEEKNKQRKGHALKYLIDAGGSALFAGTGYLVSFPIATAYNLFAEQIPQLSDGRMIEGVGSAIKYGMLTGGEVALASGIAGLLLTNYGINWVRSLLGKKR